MKMGIKILGFILLVATLPLQAQGLWKPVVENAVKESSPLATGQIESDLIYTLLKSRAERSFLQAQQAAGTTPVLMGEPIQGTAYTWLFPLTPKKIYPDRPLLKTNQHGKLAFIANNNRAFLNQLHKMEKFWPAFHRTLPLMQQEAQQMENPPDKLTWLVQNIPANTKNLFLGEYHDFSEIRMAVGNLLGLIRKQQPTRQIFLFTEFLPENTVFTSLEDYKPSFNAWSALYKYQPVWKQALQNNISVIGLEPRYARNSFAQTINHQSDRDDLWASLEGMRIRNKRWMEQILPYREKYPKALFIFYTGAGHCFYNHPFAISKRFPEGNSFVVELAPQKSKTLNFPNSRVGLLEILQDKIAFPQPVLKWKNSAFKQLSGFDAHIKILTQPAIPLGPSPHMPSVTGNFPF